MSPTYVGEIDSALDRTDPKSIERAAQALLMEEHPLFLPIGGTHDLGRDAEILKLQDEVNHRYVAISVEEDWSDKIGRDVKRIKDAGFNIKEVLYCTPREIVEGRRLEDLRARLRKDYGVELKTADRKWWITRLQQDSVVTRRVKQEELHLAPFRPSPVRTPDEYEEYLSGKQSYVLARMVGRDALIGEISKALVPGVAVIIHGKLGSGKTRVAVEAAKRSHARVVAASVNDEPGLIDALLSGPERVIMVDDAHLRQSLVERLVQAHLDPAVKRPPTLLLVAWSSSAERVRAVASDAFRVVSFEVSALGREQLAQMLRDQFSLDEANRASVLTKSEGLPLFAVLGALALGSGATREQVAQMNPLEAWFERSWPKNVPDGDAELLGVVALRGALRLVGPKRSLTQEARQAADAAGLRPEALRPHLDRYLDIGLLSYEDGRYLMTPDSLAQLVVRRLFFAERPLVTAPKPLIEAAVTTAEIFGRISQIFDGIAAELGQDGPRRILISLVEESLPAPGAEIQNWIAFAECVKDIAPFAPAKAVELARHALASRPAPSLHPLLGDVYSPAILRRKLAGVAEAALFGGTESDFREAFTLLLDLAEQEPMIQDLTGISQNTAPTMHGLLQLSRRFNPLQPGLIHVIRREMGKALADWWLVDVEKRADRVVLLLAHLLGPDIFGSGMHPDKPNQVTMRAGFVDAAGYGAVSEEVIELLEKTLGSATAEGGRSVLAQLNAVVNAARGFTGAFDTKPSDDLRKAARDVVCRVLSALTRQFGGSPGFMVRIHDLEDEAGCAQSAPASAEEKQIRELFTWERGKDLQVGRQTRFDNLAKLAASLDALSAEELGDWIITRARWANDAGLDVGTEFSMGFVADLGRRRPGDAAVLARRLIQDANTAQLAELPLMEIEAVWDNGGRELLEQWIDGTDQEKFALWSHLSRVHSSRVTPEVQLGLLVKALGATPQADARFARFLDMILIRLAGGPDAAPVLAAALESPNPTIRRAAVLRSCLAKEQHAYHIQLRPEDRAAFDRAFSELSKSLVTDPTGGMLEGSSETLTEVVNGEPKLAEKWLRSRLQELAASLGGNFEAFTQGERQALLAAAGRIDANSLLDDYAALETPSYVQSEAYKEALRTVLSDLAGAVASRIERGGLSKGKVRRLLRLVPEGTGWPQLITAASKYMSEDDLLSAVYDATFYDKAYWGSRVSIVEMQRDFFEGLASNQSVLIAGIGRKLAEYYQREAERERRQELREQYVL